MTAVASAADRVQSHVSGAIESASPFIRWLARIGYLSRGCVYLLIGTLTAMAAFGRGGSITDSKGALDAIVSQPFGVALLAAVAVGFFGYAAWQYVRAVEDPEHAGSDVKGLARRFTFFCSGCIYIGLLLSAINVIVGTGGDSDSESSAVGWSGWIMSFPLGRIVLAGIGAGILIYGFQQLYSAYKSEIGKRMRLEQLGHRARRTIIAIGRAGTGARGVVFGIIGMFLMISAWHSNASEARGLSGALRFVEKQAYGPWLLGLVALGLAAFGVYQLIEARYRRIEPAR